MEGYPAPRYPRLKRPKSVEELMPRARHLLDVPWDVNAMSLKQSYGIKAGDKVLFVALSEYDPMVIEAMCRAIRERGARVDLLTLDSTPVAPPEEVAVHEAIAMDKEEDDYSYYYTVICDLIATSTAKALVEQENYSLVIAGSAGPLPGVSFPWKRFNFTSLEHFAGPAMDYPIELAKFIDEKVHAQVMSCQTMRLTDPEGTDVQWTNYDDGRFLNPDHIFARPYNIGYGFGGKDDCTGVIAGTLNHMGAFPHLKAYIEGGQVVRVEGGGKYGDVWREKLEKYRNVKLPPITYGKSQPMLGEKEERVTYELPGPGLFWFFEAGIGTAPGFFRTEKEGLFECYANVLHERRRSGYIHHGLGPAIHAQRELIKAGIPWAHVHIHTIFNTLEGTTEKGEQITVIDKGHLTALDDPEVRALASKFGDPDALLTEAWVPAIPGINAPGDYMRDYAQDPISWIKRETLEHSYWTD